MEEEEQEGKKKEEKENDFDDNDVGSRGWDEPGEKIPEWQQKETPGL